MVLKRMINCLLMGTMVFLLVSCSGGSKVKKEDKAVSIEEHFKLGYNAAERGNLVEAVSEYRQVLKLDPKHLRAHLNLGIVYGRQGKWKEEVSQYKRAISSDPKFSEAYFNLGVAYSGRGELNEAIRNHMEQVKKDVLKYAFKGTAKEKR